MTYILSLATTYRSALSGFWGSQNCLDVVIKVSRELPHLLAVEAEIAISHCEDRILERVFLIFLCLRFILGKALGKYGYVYGRPENFGPEICWLMSLERLARAPPCEAVKVGRVGRSSGHFCYCSNDLTNREEERRHRDRKRERGKYVT
jgi:hypothetical protein